MKRLVLTVLVACVSSSAAHADPAKALAAQPLGRLFFTPAERAQLDVARMQKKPAPDTTTAAPAPEPPPMPQTVTYGGIVRRSDGKAMLWINNRLVDEKEALTGLNLKGKVRPDGAVTLQVPQTGGSINVKVGQSVELETGRVGEARKPQPEAKPAADDLKGNGTLSKPGTTSPAGAPGDPPAPPPAAKAPETSLPERKPEVSGAMGLKLDRGGRALSPAEEQQLRNRSEAR